MAMTKAERAEMEALKVQLALHWPTEAEPPPGPRPEIGGRVEGWMFNAYTRSVEKAWSTSFSHGTFWRGKPSLGSQGAASLYFSERDALIALRWALCRQMAAQLRGIDHLIERAQTPETPHG